MPTNCLVIEITEGVIQIQTLSIAFIQALSLLSNLPIDTIKIDKSFVSQLKSNSNTSSIVKTIIEMGKNLGVNIVAERIEHVQQAEFLIQNGCQYGQGYIYSPPVPPIEILQLLKVNKV